MGGRLRLRKGNRFVTVGARTTCFYQRAAGGPDGFQRIKTKDIAAVLAVAGGSYVRQSSHQINQKPAA